MLRSTLVAAVLCLACVADGTPSPADTEALTSTSSDEPEDESTSDPDPTGTTSPSTSTSTPETSSEAESSSTGEPDGPLPTPGCGTTDLLADLDGVLDVAGLPRNYLLVQPDDYDPDTLYPIIFGFHGAYDSAAGAQLGYRLEQWWEGQAIVVYPEGIPDFMTTGWSSSQGSVDHDFVLALYEAIGNAMCFDQRRGFVFGYSGGGFMANATACYHGELFRGVGAISAGLPSGDCSQPMAVFAAHGETDGTVPIGNGIGARDVWATLNGCGETSTPTDVEGCVAYDDCLDGYPLTWCTHPGGHMFFGWTAEGAVAMFRGLPN